MSGAISPLPQYAFMEWGSVKAQRQLYLYLYLYLLLCYLHHFTKYLQTNLFVMYSQTSIYLFEYSICCIHYHHPLSFLLSSFYLFLSFCFFRKFQLFLFRSHFPECLDRTETCLCYVHVCIRPINIKFLSTRQKLNSSDVIQCYR
jgi:hypothetical protein